MNTNIDWGQKLPGNLWIAISRHLPVQEVVKCRLLCRRVRDTFSSFGCWWERAQRLYPQVPVEILRLNPLSYIAARAKWEGQLKRGELEERDALHGHQLPEGFVPSNANCSRFFMNGDFERPWLLLCSGWSIELCDIKQGERISVTAPWEVHAATTVTISGSTRLVISSKSHCSAAWLALKPLRKGWTVITFPIRTTGMAFFASHAPRETETEEQLLALRFYDGGLPSRRWFSVYSLERGEVARFQDRTSAHARRTLSFLRLAIGPRLITCAPGHPPRLYHPATGEHLLTLEWFEHCTQRVAVYFSSVKINDKLEVIQAYDSAGGYHVWEAKSGRRQFFAPGDGPLREAQAGATPLYKGLAVRDFDGRAVRSVLQRSELPHKWDGLAIMELWAGRGPQRGFVELWRRGESGTHLAGATSLRMRNGQGLSLLVTQKDDQTPICALSSIVGAETKTRVSCQLLISQRLAPMNELTVPDVGQPGLFVFTLDRRLLWITVKEPSAHHGALKRRRKATH